MNSSRTSRPISRKMKSSWPAGETPIPTSPKSSNSSLPIRDANVTWATAIGFAEGESNQEDRIREIQRDTALFDSLSDPVRKALANAPVRVRAEVVHQLLSRLSVLPPERHVGLVQNLIASELAKQGDLQCPTPKP